MLYTIATRFQLAWGFGTTVDVEGEGIFQSLSFIFGPLFFLREMGGAQGQCSMSFRLPFGPIRKGSKRLLYGIPGGHLRPTLPCVKGWTPTPFTPTLS